MNTRRGIGIRCLLVVLAQGAAAAQEAEPDLTDVLGGPTVREEAKPASGLAELMGGMNERPEAPPAELALSLLELDEAARKSVEAVLTERAKAIDVFVRDNYELTEKLRELNSNRNNNAEGAREQRREVMNEVRAALQPVLEEGRLEDQIAAVLPESQVERYRGLLKDYREQARAMQSRRMAPAGGGGFLEDPPGMNEEQRDRRRQFRQRMQDNPRFAERQRMSDELRQIVSIEIPRSMKGRIEEGRENLDAMVAALDLDPETEAQVRRVFREAAAEGGGPGNADRAKLREALQEILPPEKLRQLRESRGGGRGEGRRGRGRGQGQGQGRGGT